MTPEMIAALAAKRKSVTGFFEIAFPSGTRRMLLGSGEVKWGANTFKGYDPTFGSIVGGDGISEETSGQAPNTAITVQTSSSANKAEIASSAVQLAPAKIWLAAIRFDGGGHFEAVPDPELIFDGFVDQATISLDRKKDEIDYTLVSGFDYFFEDSEGQRLSDGFHESVWSGEKGLSNVTGITRKIYWGSYGPNAADAAIGGPGGGFHGGTSCVTTDTPVLLADGTERAAGQLRVGDMLRTRHEHTLEWGEHRIIAFGTALRPVFRATIEGRELRATADHPVWLDGRWKLMGELGEPDGQDIIVKLTVDEAHTYIANGILSHNKVMSPTRGVA